MLRDYSISSVVFPKIFNWNLLRNELIRWYEVLGAKT